MSKRALLVVFVVGLAGVLALVSSRSGTVEVGLLHSSTGALGDSERPVRWATELALKRLNERGGVLGRQLVWAGHGTDDDAVDCRSDAAVCANEAERLVEAGVPTLFGCWSSACRKAVIDTLATADDWLLYYPVYYEGLEADDHVVYLGATPEQRILPGVRWARMAHGRRAYLVGSEYVFSRAVHAQIRAEWSGLRGEVVGESWLHLGEAHTAADTDWLVAEAKAAAERIAAERPDVVLSTVNGVGNLALFEQLHARGITAEQVPVLSFAYEDAQLHHRAELVRGHYTTTTWQAALPIEANEDFLTVWRESHPGEAVSEPMVAAWAGVHLWAAAVEAAGTFDVGAVRKASAELGFEGPTGLTWLDASRHAWHGMRVLQLGDDLDFDVVWSAPSPQAPNRWPARPEGPDCPDATDDPSWWGCWLKAQREEHWGGAWQAPTPTGPQSPVVSPPSELAPSGDSAPSGAPAPSAGSDASPTESGDQGTH